MRARYIAVVFLILSLSPAAFGQQAKLEGTVADDKGNAVAGVRIIAPGAQSQETDSKGHFKIPFIAPIQPGQATRIEVSKPSWVIYEPMMGACVTQSTARNFEPLKVIIVPKGSLLALSPKRINQIVAQWADERVKLRAHVAEQKSQLDDYAFLRAYTEQYGFTLEQFSNAADRWAKIKESDDKEERALKEYWQKNYDSAARLARESAVEAIEELERTNKEHIEAGRKVIRRFRLEGNSFYQQYKFGEALAAYNEIEKLFSARKIEKEDLPKEWAETRVLLGNAKFELGTRVKWQESHLLLSEAITAYREALKVYTREQLPQGWAMTQNNLGTVLWSQGERSGGEESVRLLGEAVAAYREALKVYTREQTPQDWAATQNNLGDALRSQSERSGGEESLRLLGEAVTAFREALKVYTREHLPQDWAGTQNELGKAYFLLKNWKDAAVCFENVLALYPSYEQGYQSLASIYHERLFEYAKAFELHQKWLSRFPQDTSALPDFAETHFTTGRFPEFSQRIKPLLTDPKFPASTKIALQMIEVANLLALDNAAQVPTALAALHKTISDQKADFQINWSFSGTLNFIKQQEKFASYRSWLNQFFSVAQEENRDAIVKALREAQAQFPAMNGEQRK